MSLLKSSFKSLLIGAGLFAMAHNAASAQTQVAELDRIQAPAQALPEVEQRVALVIGNSKYENVGQLANPDNDADSVSDLLSSAGFEVIAATDLTQNDMIKVMQNFSAKVAERGPNTVAMIYYAGHGVQVAGENYLIPVDAKIATPSDLINNGLRLVDLMATLETIPSRLRIVMLDSCRNNPFPNLDDSGRGLAIVDAPQRSIVGYSTSPGSEALDGADGHSPYTQAFLRLAREKNLPVEQLFKRLRLEVNHATDGAQTPWESSTATSDFYFFGDTAVASSRAPDHSPVVQVASDMPWRSVDQVYDYVLSEDSPQYYQEFLTLFPNDRRADRIRYLLSNLTVSIAWHQAVLANSPIAYKNFYDHHMDSPYANAALHLQTQPKHIPLMQADHVFKGNGGFQHQIQLSNHAKMTMFPARGGFNAPSNGKIVNLPSQGKIANVPSHEKFTNETSHERLSNNSSREKAAEHNFNSHGEFNSGKSERHFESSRPQHFESHQSSSYGRFSNTQARMGGGGGGGGFNAGRVGGGGGGFNASRIGGGGGFGGGGFHHR